MSASSLFHLCLELSDSMKVFGHGICFEDLYTIITLRRAGMSTLNCLRSEDNRAVLGNIEIQGGVLGRQHK